MRARFDASAGVLSTRLPARPLRLLAFLPAVVVTAAAIHAPAALALSSDQRWQGKGASHAVRRVVEANEEARPRRSTGRKYGKARRRGHRQTRAAGRHRRQSIAVHAARKIPRTVEAGPRLVVASTRADIVPLERRSLVAIHPLSSDPIAAGPNHGFGGDSPADAQAAPPRCERAHANSFALALASFARGFRASEPAMVEGAWPHCRRAPQPQSSWRLASLGSDLPAPGPSTAALHSDSSIRWRASASCLASPLRAILDQVASEFGPLTVNSTCRSRRHNARVGGAPRSYHLTGNAVDFRVRSHYRQVLAFLRRLGAVGGLKHYGRGVFHIDTGPRRTWGSRRSPRRG